MTPPRASGGSGETCPCASGSPLSYEGPLRDCPVHGEYRPVEPEALSEEELEWLKSSHFQSVRDLVGEANRLRARERALVEENESATAKVQLWYDTSVDGAKRVLALETALTSIMKNSDDECAVDVARAALEKP